MALLGVFAIHRLAMSPHEPHDSVANERMLIVAEVSTPPVLRLRHVRQLLHRGMAKSKTIPPVQDRIH